MASQEELDRVRLQIIKELEESDDPVCASLLNEVRWVATDSCVELRVASRFALGKLEEKRLSVTEKIQSHINGLAVRIVVDPSPVTSQTCLPGFETSGAPVSTAAEIRNLLLDFTFDRFVVGDSNSVAYTLTKAVAQGRWIRTVFLVGDTGCGKTHLLKAAVGAFRERAGAPAKYVLAERYANAFTSALRNGSAREMPRFRAEYRDVGLLAVDELQFFAGKEGFTGEFLHMVKDREDRRLPLLLSSTAPLRDLKFPPELTRRLEAAFCPIDPPDDKMRMDLVLQMAERLGLEFDEEWASLVAGRTKSIGQVESGLNRLHVYVTRLGRKLNGALVEEVFVQGTSGSLNITVHNIISAVAAYHGFSEKDLKTKSKARRITEARWDVMEIARELLPDVSMSDIGSALGNMDHTSVSHALSKRKELARVPGRGEKVTSVEKIIRSLKRA